MNAQRAIEIKICCCCPFTALRLFCFCVYQTMKRNCDPRKWKSGRVFFFGDGAVFSWIDLKKKEKTPFVQKQKPDLCIVFFKLSGIKIKSACTIDVILIKKTNERKGIEDYGICMHILVFSYCCIDWIQVDKFRSISHIL